MGTGRLGLPCSGGLQAGLQLHQQAVIAAGGDDLVDARQVFLEAVHHLGGVTQRLALQGHQGTVQVAQQPFVVGKHPGLDLWAGFEQQQGGDRRFHRNMVTSQETAIGLDDTAAVEAGSGQVDAQGLDLLQHGPRRPSGGQARRATPASAQRTDRVQGGGG